MSDAAAAGGGAGVDTAGGAPTGGGGAAGLPSTADEEPFFFDVGGADEDDASEPVSSRVSDCVWRFARECATHFRPGSPFRFSPSTPTMPDREDFYLKSVWLIDLWTTYAALLGGAKNPHCVCCKCANIEQKGWTDKGPRRIIDRDDVIYIWGKRYKCRSCSTHFMSYDSDVLLQFEALIPGLLPTAFGAVLTHKLGVTERLLNFIREARVGGVDFESIATLIEADHMNRYVDQRIAYDALAGAVIRCRQSFLRKDGSVVLPKSESFAPFGDFGAPNGYAGRLIKASFVRALYVADSLQRKHTLLTRLSMVPGSVVKFDGSYKVCVAIHAGGTRPYLVLQTMMNEHGQIMFSAAYPDNAIREEPLRLVAERKVLWGEIYDERRKSSASTSAASPGDDFLQSISANRRLPMITHAWVDNCCNVERVLSRALLLESRLTSVFDVERGPRSGLPPLLQPPFLEGAVQS